MGLLGTVVMPIMEKRIGLTQTGTRSIVFVLSLSSSVVADSIR